HLQSGLANMGLLNGEGLGLTALDPDGVAALEPALAHFKGRLAGAIYAPQDESGDAFVFAEKLAELCRARGVTFLFNTTITGLAAEGDRIAGVVTEGGRRAAGGYVLALGSYSPLAARGLSLKLPVYPIKGYSVTIPTAGFDGAPTIAGVDEGNLIAFCRMGDKLRFTATADFAGYDTGYEAADFAPMLRVARELFPKGGAFDRPSHGACLRPMTPDGPPIIGGTRYRNLWINTGQGHMGWTMACGSARIVADLIGGKKPDIDISGFSPDRY